MLRVVALLALVAAASAHHTFPKAKCPMVPGKYPFDLEKFHGDWFVYAANEESLAMKGKCGKITFPNYIKDDKKDDMVFATRYTAVSVKDNSPIAYEAYFQPAFFDKLGLLHGVFRAEGSSTYTPVAKQSIVATDYMNYAVVLACKPTFDGETKTFGRKMHAEIWTRKEVTLSKDTFETLKNVLASYDVEPATIKMVDQTC